MKKNKSKLLRLLALTAGYTALTFIVLFFVVNALNNKYVMHATAQEAPTSSAPLTAGPSPSAAVHLSPSLSPSPSKDPRYTDFSLTSLPPGATNLTFSHDGRYCVALWNGKLEIADITTDRLVSTIIESSPISRFILMHNQNMLIYACMDPENYQLVVKNYNLTNGIGAVQKTIDISYDTVLKQFDYSSSMSLVYLTLETGGTSPRDTVYYLDANKTLKYADAIGVIQAMAPLNKTLNLYCEGANHYLYSGTKAVAELKNKAVALLGCDGSDNVFAQSLDDRSSVYVLSGDKLVKTIHLSDLKILDTVSDKEYVYLVYSDYMLRFSADNTLRFDYDRKLTFAGLAGDTAYFSKGGGAYTALKLGR